MLKKIKPVVILICGLIVVFTLIACPSKNGNVDDSIDWRPTADWRSIPYDPSFVIQVFDAEYSLLSNGSSTAHRNAYVDCYAVPNPDPSSTVSFNGQVWIYVNDVPTQATVYGPEPFYIWDQPISLQSGTNSIVAVVFRADGSGYGRTEEWTITGTFANPLFRAQLTWDTDYNDVDLHLVKDDTWDDFNHISYWNMVIPGMAELDYDDTDGYGPENISIETTAPAGSYKLLVKYFWGEVTVNAAVQIFDQNDALISTHTHVFTADDVSLYDDEPEQTDWVVITLTAP